MATLRKRVTRNQRTRITPECVVAFQAGDEVELHRLLRLPPWQVSPIQATGECCYGKTTAGYATWQDSLALRQALEELAGEL